MRRTEQAQGLRLMKFEEVYGRTSHGCPGRGGGGAGRVGTDLPALAIATRRRARRVSTTAAWAGSRPGARRWTKWCGCLSCSTPATGTSPSTSTRSWSPSTLRAQLQLGAPDLAGTWAHAGCAPARRAPAQASAPSLPGMMLHQDGSHHAWVPGRRSLIVTMDDATSEIYSPSSSTRRVRCRVSGRCPR